MTELGLLIAGMVIVAAARHTTWASFLNQRDHLLLVQDMEEWWYDSHFALGRPFTLQRSH